MAINLDTDTAGWRVRQLRIKNGWSQAEVAKRLKLSIPAFSKIEIGVTELTVIRVIELAEIFQVSVLEILVKDGENAFLKARAKINRLNKEIKEMDKEITALRGKIIDLYDELYGLSDG